MKMVRYTLDVLLTEGEAQGLRELEILCRREKSLYFSDYQRKLLSLLVRSLGRKEGR